MCQIIHLCFIQDPNQVAVVLDGFCNEEMEVVGGAEHVCSRRLCYFLGQV